MQTFLPYESFELSAKVLDWQRLNKQRTETKQMLEALLGLPSRWRNHPATVMWEGHERALAEYGRAICQEWILRGYNDAQMPLFEAWLSQLPDTGRPSWLGRPSFHASHRSNLVRKLPEHYRRFFPEDPDNLPYEWPGAD
jgi:hypothetical protein